MLANLLQYSVPLLVPGAANHQVIFRIARALCAYLVFWLKYLDLIIPFTPRTCAVTSCFAAHYRKG